MLHFKQTPTLLLALFASLFAYTANAGSNSGARISTGQSCEAHREWGGFMFDAQLQQQKDGGLKVNVDMSRTKWEVGVVEAWLESGGKKILPARASTGAVVNNESSNTPALVGGTGLVFDDIRNRHVGGDRKIGAAVTGTAGMVMDQRGMQARKSRFDPSTVRWNGEFQPASALDCKTKLWVRYWYPEGGVKGSKALKIGHCICK